MNRILLVEDNGLIVKGLEYTLRQAGYDVTACLTALEAVDRMESDVFDLALLDVMLPDGSGFDVFRALRELRPDTPVIFLTARDGEDDVVLGFELGAEDYVVKPFRNRELLMRIQTVLRRYSKHEREITVGNVRMDIAANRVFLDEAPIELTALEYKLLQYLFQNRGQTLTRDQLLDRIWDCAGNIVEDNTLTVYIRRLRQKLGDDVIRTVKGIGYRVEAS